MVGNLAFHVSAIGSCLVLGTAYLCLRGTVLDVTRLRDNPWPAIWYLQMILVLLPLMVVGYMGIPNLPALRLAYSGLETPVAVVVIVSLMVYVCSLAAIMRLVGLRMGCVLLPARLTNNSTMRRVKALSCFIAILGLSLVAVFHALGYKHAFVFSMLRDRPLLQVRLDNAYYSKVPSTAASMLDIMGILLASLAGYIARKRALASLKYFLVSLFILTAPGDKILPIMGISLWVMAQGNIVPKSIWSFKSLKFVLTFVPLVLILIYFVVRIQVPSMSLQAFGDYLVARLGVGQMAGVYETAALISSDHRMPDGLFLHMVPFASLCQDYVDYQKYLMMVSEGYNLSQMGRKNTYFLAEAYAIGGPFLAAMSPLIVAFSTSVGILFLLYLCGRLFGQDLAWVSLPLYLITHNVTGGFSNFPMFKGWILLVLQLGILWVGWLLWQALLLRTRLRL